MERTEPAVPEQLDSIQAMRAFAAIAVVLHHIAVFRVDGTWGVDVFFVISGFMMCYVTAASGRNFLLKRVIRVVPLYWAGTIGVFCIALAWPDLLYRSTASLEGLVKSLAFIPYDKGDGVIQPLLFLGWTMNFEMLFYALFAASMAISHAWRGWICSAVLVAIGLAGVFHEFESVVLEFFTRRIIFDFVMGIAVYGLLVRSVSWRADPRNAGVRRGLVIAGVGILLFLPFSGYLAHEHGRTLTQSIPSAFCFVFLLIGLSTRRLPKLLTIVGDSSYSLYLFHPYVVFAFDRRFHAFDSIDLRSILMSVFVIALCCGLSVLIYHRIEVPVQKWLRSRLIRRPAPRDGAQAVPTRHAG